MPSYSIEDAPKPDIVLFPGGPSSKIYDDPEFFAWAKKASVEAEIAQSVCTGAFVLGKAGLLDGLEVTTFHGAIDGLQKSYPKAMVKRGRRFVDNGHVVTTAGISAGIDGSLHVVARLLGRRVADEVATYMEYAWSPEASLAMEYSYLNPSTDARRPQVADRRHAARGEELRRGRGDVPRAGEGQSGERRRVGEPALGRMRGKDDASGAAEAFAKAAGSSTGQRSARSYYNSAACYALAGRKDDAVGLLQKAYDAGFADKTAVDTDEDFASLRGDPRLKQMTAAR